MAKAKMMVALRDKTSVEGLISLACYLANGMDAELIALHVVQIPLATPIDANNQVIDQEGKEILALADRLAAGRVPGRLFNPTASSAQCWRSNHCGNQRTSYWLARSWSPSPA